MGRKYSVELQKLPGTYHWAFNAEVSSLADVVRDAYGGPLIVVSSGGSLTAARVVELLHQQTGYLAKVMTPLELQGNTSVLRDASVIAISANGMNQDILNAFRTAATSSTRQLAAVCMRRESRLARMARTFKHARMCEFELPSGKDGFLATNSMLAFVTLFARAFESGLSINANLTSEFPGDLEEIYQWSTQNGGSLDRSTWIGLSDGWAYPAAVDIESKFSESALASIQIVDYRNFAHGRHYWLHRHQGSAGVVAFLSPQDKDLARKTLRLIPPTIPTIEVETSRPKVAGTIELLTKVLFLVGEIGNIRGIDPGRPQVPEFGRQMFHLRTPRKMIGDQMKDAILYKLGLRAVDDISTDEFIAWKKALNDFLAQITSTTFGSIVLDYDGTLCEAKDRYFPPREDVASDIVRLLKHGIVVGVATGRGDSVRESLQSVIPERYWARVLVGYHNGAEIGTLSENNVPNYRVRANEYLQDVSSALERRGILDYATIHLTPNQITVRPKSPLRREFVKRQVLDVIAKLNKKGIRLTESKHSFDIVTSRASKVRLLEKCAAMALASGNSGNCLCIGDQGDWPGNDFELLSTPFSLSVGSVSPNPKNCWNFCPAGKTGVDCTQHYLRAVAFTRKGSFSLRSEPLKGE